MPNNQSLPSGRESGHDRQMPRIPKIVRTGAAIFFVWTVFLTALRYLSWFVGVAQMPSDVADAIKLIAPLAARMAQMSTPLFVALIVAPLFVGIILIVIGLRPKHEAPELLGTNARRDRYAPNESFDIEGSTSVLFQSITDDNVRIVLSNVTLSKPARLMLRLSTVMVDRHQLMDFHRGKADYVYSQSGSQAEEDISASGIILTPTLGADRAKPAHVEIILSHLLDGVRNASARFVASGFDGMPSSRHFSVSGAGALMATRARVIAIEILPEAGDFTGGHVDFAPLTNPSAEERSHPWAPRAKEASSKKEPPSEMVSPAQWNDPKISSRLTVGNLEVIGDPENPILRVRIKNKGAIPSDNPYYVVLQLVAPPTFQTILWLSF